MKKIIAMLLVLVMALSLCACDKQETPNPTGGDSAADATTGAAGDELPKVFMAGFGKADITPEEFGVPMQGYDNNSTRLSNGLYSYIYSIALAVRDAEGNTAIIISVDNAAIGESISKPIREDIEKKTGVPYENIFITAIHQHSTPCYATTGFATSANYKTLIMKRITESAVDALDDLAPAEMYTAIAETEGIAFVKHYLMNDGSYCGDNYGSSASGYKAHESEADNDLQMVKFVREGQKTVKGKDAKDILMCNFQGHPHSGTSSGDTNISADVPGIFREEVEAKTDLQVMYISGAQGNLNMASRITEENIYGDYKARGKALANYAIKAVKDDVFTKVETGKVGVSNVVYEGKTDHTMDHLVQEATAIDDVWKNTHNSSQAMAKGTSGEIHSVYHAAAIISKAKEGLTKTMPVMAVSFGDIAICGGMYEMFDTNGMEIKAGSPFKMTFVAHMVNGTHGYVPSAMSYENGCYSADITRYAPGSGEELRDTFLNMLKELRG